MSKRELLNEGLANVRESMGDFGNVVRGAPTPGPRALPAHLKGVVRSKDVSQIDLDRIVRDEEQPREEFEEEPLERLAQSLRTRGQLQPIRVRWSEEKDAYMVVVGERRWRAARMAGIESLSCVVVEGSIPSDELLAIQMIENAVREDLKPIEQAKAYRRLIEAKDWSARQLAAELAIHHAQVVRALALLELPTAIQDQVESGALPPASAYEVSKLENPAAQEEVARRVVDEKLSRSETVEAVRKAASKPGRAGGSKAKAAQLQIPTERSVRTDGGVKIVARYKKGLSVEAWAEALEEAARIVRAKLVPPDQATT